MTAFISAANHIRVHIHKNCSEITSTRVHHANKPKSDVNQTQVCLKPTK